MRKSVRFFLVFSLALSVSLIKTAMPRWWEASPAAEPQAVSEDWTAVPATEPAIDYASLSDAQMDRLIDSHISTESRQAIKDLDRTIAAVE